MSVLESKLKQFLNEEIVVVMTDNRAFRGTLVEFDGQAIVLRNVVEGIPSGGGGWSEPTVSTGIIEKVVTWNGVFSHENASAELVRLKDALIMISGVLRIWEFSMKNLAKPEHVTEAQSDMSRAGPATRVTRRP